MLDTRPISSCCTSKLLCAEIPWMQAREPGKPLPAGGKGARNHMKKIPAYSLGFHIGREREKPKAQTFMKQKPRCEGQGWQGLLPAGICAWKLMFQISQYRFAGTSVASPATGSSENATAASEALSPHKTQAVNPGCSHAQRIVLPTPQPWLVSYPATSPFCFVGEVDGNVCSVLQHISRVCLKPQVLTVLRSGTILYPRPQTRLPSRAWLFHLSAAENIIKVYCFLAVRTGSVSCSHG